VIVGLEGLWAGDVAMTSAGGPGLGPVGVAVYVAFAVVFAAAGEMRQRGLRRARVDAERLADMQLRLVQVARLNAMGEMAGTLAHELNQPLTAIASYAGAAHTIVQRAPSVAPEVADLLQKVADQAVRAREIIGRIRGHVSGEELAPQAQSLSALFREAVAIANPGGLRPDVQLRYEFDAAADHVLADKVQVQQVMVNLVRNAIEAMAGASRKPLLIRSRRTASHVAVDVRDQGTGLVDPEKIFEPFVSTKETGMGMGLTICRSIVEAHAGEIRVVHNDGLGVTFSFSLPIEAPDAT
jgi:two-component system sensor kinase FixL